MILAREKYFIEDIYETFGQFDWVATFFFKEGTDAFHKYGSYITGLVVYSFNERQMLEEKIKSSDNDKTEGVIKLKYLMYDKDEDFKSALLSQGFHTSDLKHVEYLPSDKQNKFTSDETDKEVPNIIKIPLSDIPNIDKLNFDNISMKLFESRFYEGKDVLYEDQCRFAGMLLAITEGKIPPNIDKYCGLTVNEVNNNAIVYRQYLESKEKRSGLNKEEKIRLIDLEMAHTLKNITKFDEELKLAFGTKFDITKNQSLYDFLKNEVVKFKKERLLQIRQNIYWDIQSFCHIYLRHVKETKVEGNSKSKSIIPYGYEEIRRLIQQVLKTIKEEIEDHFKENNTRFFRAGKKSVYYNGDYFCIYISKDGKLENFYPKDRHYKKKRK
ncbi:MAG: hypothetical protein WD607_03845, partial [Candidatus Paceibacterota bacterium]